MKDPHQRLSWPELLSHPFIAGRVTREYQLFFQHWPGLFPPVSSYCLEAGRTTLLCFFYYPVLCLPPLSFLQALTPSSCPWACSGSPGIPLGSQSQSLSLCPKGELLMKFSPHLPSD